MASVAPPPNNNTDRHFNQADVQIKPKDSTQAPPMKELSQKNWELQEFAASQDLVGHQQPSEKRADSWSTLHPYENTSPMDRQNFPDEFTRSFTREGSFNQIRGPAREKINDASAPLPSKNQATNIATEIKDAVAAKGAEIKESLPSVNQVASKATEIKDNLVQKGAEIKDTITEKASEVYESLPSSRTIANKAAQTKDAIAQKANEVVESLPSSKTIASKAKDAIAQKASDVYEALPPNETIVNKAAQARDTIAQKAGEVAAAAAISDHQSLTDKMYAFKDSIADKYSDWTAPSPPPSTTASKATVSEKISNIMSQPTAPMSSIRNHHLGEQEPKSAVEKVKERLADKYHEWVDPSPPAPTTQALQKKVSEMKNTLIDKYKEAPSNTTSDDVRDYLSGTFNDISTNIPMNIKENSDRLIIGDTTYNGPYVRYVPMVTRGGDIRNVEIGMVDLTYFGN